MNASKPFLYSYIGVVAAVGCVLLAVMVVVAVSSLPADSATFWVLVVGVVIGELKPVTIVARNLLAETASTTFAFALVLGVSPLAAALSLAVGTLIADKTTHKEWYKVAFNVGQYSLTIGAASLVIRGFTGSWILIRHGRVSFGDIAPMLLAMLAFFVVNNLLIGLVMAFLHGGPVLPRLREEFVLQAFADGVLLALSPVVLVVAEGSLALVPFLVVPILAVYLSTRSSLDKQYQALHDALTGLPNRLLFRERITETLSASAPGDRLAVLLLDLDGFKDVNDTLGHHIGDLLLKEVGPRLAGIVPPSHEVARLGGDEFAVLVPELNDAKSAMVVANRLVAALADPFEVEDLRLHVDASVGISIYPDDGEDADTLLQRADVAMYVAKDERSRVELYSSERDVHSRRRLRLLGELRGAIAENQLILHYQPLVDLESRRILGVEALVRWEHPTLGFLPPGEFIPLAERSGLIGALSEYVLQIAVAQNAAWQAEGINVRTAVNLSVRNLADLQLPLLVAKLLDRAGISADCLDLEITESTIMADPERAMTVLDPLSRMGIRLSIDDFGTGYSSLAYLRQLPLSVLKIDQSFVGHMLTSENDAIIVRSTIDLAKNLGLEVIAEGVEDEATAVRLLEMGCHFAQGYHFSRPLPPDDLHEMLIARASNAPITGRPGG